MIQPLHDRVVVKPQVRELSAVIQVQNREAFNLGEVMAVGPEVTEIKPGDLIRYGNGDYLSWNMFEIAGHKVQIIQEADVVGIEAA